MLCPQVPRPGSTGKSGRAAGGGRAARARQQGTTGSAEGAARAEQAQQAQQEHAPAAGQPAATLPMIHGVPGHEAAVAEVDMAHVANQIAAQGWAENAGGFGRPAGAS